MVSYKQQDACPHVTLGDQREGKFSMESWPDRSVLHARTETHTHKHRIGARGKQSVKWFLKYTQQMNEWTQRFIGYVVRKRFTHAHR